MSFFTDSPYERMMVQKPKQRREAEPPAEPKKHRCRGCNYRRDGCCSGTCYRDLIITPKKKEAEKCDL